jgi:hypothetical protein
MHYMDKLPKLRYEEKIEFPFYEEKSTSFVSTIDRLKRLRDKKRSNCIGLLFQSERD